MTRTAQDHVREATQMFGDGDERVLFAAAQLFREEGFAGTTVREIAAAAKMLPGSLHYRRRSPIPCGASSRTADP